MIKKYIVLINTFKPDGIGLILELRKLRQEDHYKFEASIGYTIFI